MTAVLRFWANLRFASKISILLAVSSATGIVVTTTLFARYTHDRVLEANRAKAVSIVTAALPAIDVDDVIRIDRYLRKGEGTEKGAEEAFNRLNAVLTQIAAVDPTITYVYLYARRGDDHLLQELVSTDDTWEEIPGMELFDAKPFPAMIEGFLRPAADKEVLWSETGESLSGYTPVRNKMGNPVALLGVDIRGDFVRNALSEVVWISVGIAAAMILASLLLGYVTGANLSRPVARLVQETDRIAHGGFEPTPVTRADEFGKLELALNEMKTGLRERMEVKDLFSRYVSHQVAEELMTSDRAALRKGRSQYVTVLFSDLANFTTMSEGSTPEDVVHLLNEYFSLMTRIVFKHEGTVDKYIGDGVMAVFGSPLPIEQAELKAVRAAGEMLVAVDQLNVRLRAEGKPEIAIRIGIHSGQAVVGTVGSEQRMEFTAIGDTVNVAARLEGLNKQYGTRICVSSDTARAIGDAARFRLLGRAKVKGRNQELEVFTVEEASGALKAA